MKTYDISLPLSENTPRWPGSIGFHRSETTHKDPYIRNSTIHMDVHCGTHLDAPSHHIIDGTPIDEINLKRCIGPAQVIDCTGLEAITSETLSLKNFEPGISRVLFKTDNSDIWNQKKKDSTQTVGLSLDAAVWLVDHNIEFIGIDWLSIQRYNDYPDVHQYLLEKEIIILEGIDLSVIDPGIYYLICLPMKIEGGEAAPARVILFEPGGILI